MTQDPQELIDALAPLFATDVSVSNEQLAAVVGAIDQPDSRPLIAACCRTVALRSLIVAASQSNNAEAARRAAMTLLERFAPDDAEDNALAIEHTRRLLQQDAAE